MAYDSIEAINKDFGKRIKDTDSDDEKRSLALEQREAIADFRLAVAERRELEAHKATVVAAKGLGEWADMVNGSTPEEIEASAAKIAERVAKLSAAANDAAAAAAYGSAGSAGGAAPGTKPDEAVEKMQDFERRFNESTRGSAIRTGDGAKISVNEAQQYVGTIGAARIIDHLARTGSKPGVRSAMQRIDLQTLKAKG